MKVLLLESVYKLGDAGAVVDVKPGYARNFLIPRKFAQPLSKKALAEIEEVKRVAVRRADRELHDAKELAGRLEGHMVRMSRKTGARGQKLYGSVTTQALASAVGQFLGAEIDKRKVTIPDPIKTLGIHKYQIRLHSEVIVEGQVEVVKAGKE